MAEKSQLVKVKDGLLINNDGKWVVQHNVYGWIIGTYGSAEASALALEMCETHKGYEILKALYSSVNEYERREITLEDMDEFKGMVKREDRWTDKDS